MRLLTTLIRPNGSRHEIDGIHYHFAPSEADPRHTCEVAASRHVKRFLEIPGFEIAEEGVEAPEPAPEPAPTPIFSPGPQSILDGNTSDNAVTNPAPVDYEAMDREALQDLFRERFGREPHPKAGKPKLIEALINHDLANSTAGAGA